MNSGEPIWQLPPVTVHQVMMEFDQSALPWHVADFGIDKQLWPIPSADKPEIIGLIDTGVSRRHVESGELAGQVIEARDFTNSLYGAFDQQGHGSHTGGIMVAKSFGIAKNVAKIVSAKGLGDNGSGSDSQIVRAIGWCLDQGATVLNLSLGSPYASPSINAILREAQQQGVIPVCAAGNSGSGIEEPAAQSFVMAITAIDRNRKLASFSCRGEQADTCGPGVEITSLNRGGSYAVLSGTSMACPWVAAVVAVKRAIDKAAGRPPLKSVDDVIAWLGRESTDLGETGRDWSFGVGLPDPEKIAAGVASQPGPVTGEARVGLQIEIDGVKYQAETTAKKIAA